MSSNEKTSEQLVKSINSKEMTLNHIHLDYYKFILSLCYSDNNFENMVNSINIKEITSFKNKDTYLFIVKNSNNENVIVGPVKDNMNFSLSDLFELTIPMTHYHLSKKKIVKNNFFHKIMYNETNATKKFIQRLRLIDNKIKQLISNFIKDIDTTSPIANFLQKHKVTYDQNWIYTGIISKSNKNDTEYINIHYYKNTDKRNTKIGTNVYLREDFSDDLDDLLSRDTYFYVYGNIYPIIKVSCVLINELMINGKPVVNFTCKAYFVDMVFSSIHCNVNST
ncbi:hypothetical protein PIROE2DRAFT_6603 [Piromyces sp. E2]|nr:hypothetical protein PIROE2DRAFT_6603 [Piromyces sp. E2]|eukprot:OUM66257.1 hypothetical protein PIROE2DRAFT_6603 [Piromyces sp. E2]